jgi:TonB-dependent starch-binding outer membrane protein SusC
MQKSLFTALLILLMWEVSLAQRTVTGKVDSEGGEALPGVSIIVKGTTVGTTTDVNGAYRLEVPSTSETLVFSFIGYLAREESIGNKTVINVSLKEDITSLEEVVVVGYGTSSKRLTTGAMANVNGEKLTSLNPVRMDQALQGQMAGLQVSSGSGSPGGSMNIRIRGITTNGNNSPLVLVDGIIYSVEGLNALNPADIESINVLKDASAAIYGVQAANGVILVTTKKGTKNSGPAIEFSGYYGIQETAKQINLLNAREFAVLKNETYGAGGLAHPFNNVNLGEGTNWQKEVFQQAPIQNYNINLNGGSDKSSYSIGGSYLDQQGIIGGEKARYKRYNARLNYVTELSSKVNLQSLFLYTNEFRKTVPENGIGSVLYNTINASPVASVLDPLTGKYTYLMEFSDIINPLAQISNSFNETFVNKMVGKEEINYKITNALEVTARGGYNYALVDSKNFSPLVWYGTGKAQNTAADENLTPKMRVINDLLSLPENGSVREARATYFNYSFEGFLNYNHTFSDVHTVKGTIGTSFFGGNNHEVGGTGFGIPYNSWDYADLSQAKDPLLGSSFSNQDRSRLQSFFARVEYNYLDRYLLTGIFRRDGSSNFGPNNKFGTFPSVLAAWIVSEEDFFPFSGVSLLKIRGSYGVIGNDKIDRWSYRAQLGGEAVYPFDGQLRNGVAIGAIGNPDIKWETTHQSNFGFELTALSDKISVSADYYIKKTKDLLFRPDIAAIIGGYGAGESAPIINGGDVRNNGFEFLISYKDHIGKDLNFSISYNVTTLHNEVTRLPEGKDFIAGGAFGVGGTTATRMEVGFPIGYFFGYKTDGIYQTEEEIAERGVTQSLARPGDLRIVDIDGNKEIDFSNNSDKTMIGSPLPDVMMGINFGVNYKGFDFATTLYSSIGNDILRNYERQQPMANNLAQNIDRWTGPNSSNEVPRLTTEQTRNAVISDYFVEDGSFVRIKNLQLGYALPPAIAHKIKATRMRIYVAANNVYTFTKYKGFDPDFSSSNPLTSGIDYGFYPQARTYMVGLNLNF